ncbi:MAG: alpha-E domain-containing protein, partial [bacterium]
SQHFLGRNLRLNSVATWWCGNPDHYQHVLANLDQMIIKPVFRTPNVSSVVVSELDDQQRSQLLTQLASRPVNFVAQEKLTPSSMPLFDGQQLSPRPTILRTYAVADASSYRVMPGGLTRVGISEDSSLISNQLGSVSKDTWVLASEPEPQASALDDVQEIEAAANLMSLPSRVVENLFWLGRYGERAENGLRLLRTAFNHINGGSDLSEAARTRLLYAITHQTATYPGFVNDPSKLNDAHAELIDVLTNAARSGSIRQCIDAMLACAEESKGLFSSDGQRIINDIRDEVSGLGSSANTTGSYGLEQSLNQMISRLMALSAIIQESMVRGTGWRFVEIGRRLERSLQIVYLLRATLTHEMSGEDKSTLLECVLRSIESLVACQRRFPGSLSVRNTLDMSLLDSTNPRSILFQLNELVDHIDHLPLGAPRGELEKEQRCALEALNLVRLSQLDYLAYPKDGEGVLSDLDQMFSRLTYLLTETSNHLSARFFVHEQQLRQLVDQRLDY